MHTSNTINGITTIRACNNSNILSREFNIHSDYHTQSYFAFISANRWLAVRLDLLASVYTVFVVFLSIFLRGKKTKYTVHVKKKMI